MMAKYPFWYAVDGDLETRYQLGSACKITDVSWRDSLATDAAEDYHGNHDGWESSWPLVVVLFASETGPEVARFKVALEMVPSFSAYEVKED